MIRRIEDRSRDVKCSGRRAAFYGCHTFVHVRVPFGCGRLLSFAEMLPFVSSSCSINAEEGVACAWVGLHEGERWVRLTSPDEQRLDAASAEDPTATVAMLGGRVRLGARLEPGAVHGPSL